MVRKEYHMKKKKSSEQNKHRIRGGKTEVYKIASKPKSTSFISDIIFYFFIAAAVIAAFLYSQRSGKGSSIFGYSYFNILTTSMQSEMPAGSFILVKSVAPNRIEIGDDITFFQNEDTIITHRVIDILEDYEDSNQLGFQTKGVDNPEPDKEITFAGNMIGKVIWHIPILGFILAYIADHVVLLGILFVILVLLVFFLRNLFGSDDGKK